MDVLWNTDEYILDNSLTVLISRMRSKIKKFVVMKLFKLKKERAILLHELFKVVSKIYMFDCFYMFNF